MILARFVIYFSFLGVENSTKIGGDLMTETFSETNDKTVLTVHEVAQYLRLSQAKVYRLAKAGKIPAMRIGKSWRFRKDMIDKWFHQGAQVNLETNGE